MVVATSEICCSTQFEAEDPDGQQIRTPLVEGAMLKIGAVRQRYSEAPNGLIGVPILATATHCFQSADAAIPVQNASGEPVGIQVLPESLDRQMSPGFIGGSDLDAASKFVPSADDAIEVQSKLGALVFVQVAPESAEV